MAAQRRVLAISSGGGHWIQLFRMRQAFDGHLVTYASTMKDLAAGILQDAAERGQSAPRYVQLVEANRWQKTRVIQLALSVAWLVLKVRPHTIISTGAAHGFFAIVAGRLIGAKTVWIDSIANAEELSGSGRQVARFAHHRLSQWPDVAAKEGVEFHGAVL
jgi:UDP-N-acetylglucosamine:LPS N-acetylglucosamine transferase